MMSANPISAARRLAARLRRQADDLDGRLAAFERAEQLDDGALPTLPAARLLVSLFDLTEQADELVEVLDEYVEDLPPEATAAEQAT